MSSIRKSIRDRVLTELNVDDTNTPIPEGVPVAVSRRWIPGVEITDPQINVFCIEESTGSVGGRGGVLSRRSLTLAVQCVISTLTPDLSDDAVEPLLEHVAQRLGSTTLNKLTTEVQETKTTWEAVKLNRYYLAATVILHVEFQTKRDDLSKKQ